MLHINNFCKKEIFHHVKERFSTDFSESLSIRFVHLGNGPKAPKKTSLITQSVETIKLAWYALRQLTPHIYIDTTGCAFTFLVAKLAGCKIICYVHYPTISTVRGWIIFVLNYDILGWYLDNIFLTSSIDTYHKHPIVFDRICYAWFGREDHRITIHQIYRRILSLLT